MPRTILLVEDDADTRAGMTLRLRSWGYDVTQAADGQSAITLAQKRRPDLVLLDLGLPAGDGFTVLQRLSRLANTAGVPVVVLTARAAESDHERARSLGAAAVLVKPADNDALLALIRQHVPPESTPHAEGAAAAPKRILLIEDDADTRAGLRLRLQASGYVVATAGDAATAMTHVVHEKPDVILLDLGLPAGDGFVVLERLKKNHATSLIPVVVLSARDPALNAPRALGAGAVAFLQKPPDNAQLLSILERAIDGA